MTAVRPFPVVAAFTLVMACLIAGHPPAAPARAADAAAEPARRLVNDRCPVMTDEFTTPLHEITFRGVAVRFCCRECKERFLLNPDPYLANLPHVPPQTAT